MTGQLYLDIANVFLKMERREEAIRFLGKAFQIFDTAKHEESFEKASLATQISLILFEFGSFKECINFAIKSNEIYEQKLRTDNSFLANVCDNKILIAKASEKLDSDQSSLEECEKTFNLVTRRSNWTPTLGKYIVEVLRVTFQVLIKGLTHTKKCNIYYIMDLIGLSFQYNDPTSDLIFMQQLKDKCELHKNCTNFVRSLILIIESHTEDFAVSRLVNTTYEYFYEDAEIDVVRETMEDLKIVYFCLGTEFLLTQIKPLN